MKVSGDISVEDFWEFLFEVEEVFNKEVGYEHGEVELLMVNEFLKDNHVNNVLIFLPAVADDEEAFVDFEAVREVFFVEAGVVEFGEALNALEDVEPVGREDFDVGVKDVYDLVKVFFVDADLHLRQQLHELSSNFGLRLVQSEEHDRACFEGDEVDFF